MDIPQPETAALTLTIGRVLRNIGLAGFISCAFLSAAAFGVSESEQPAILHGTRAVEGAARSVPVKLPWLDVEPLSSDKRDPCLSAYAPGKAINVLAVDGGGVRGIIPASILAYLEARTGVPSAELFDLISGVSTGSLIAAALTKPNSNGRPSVPASLIAESYLEDVSSLFPSGFLAEIKGTAGLLRPKFDPAALQRLLKKRFGDMRLSDLLAQVVIPVYDLKTNKAWLLQSAQARKDSIKNFYIRDMLRASTAAPIVYPPMKLANICGDEVLIGVDAGMFFNNPAELAEAEAQALWPDRKMNILSLGTGVQSAPVVDLESRFGLLDWIPGVFMMGSYGQESIANIETVSQLRERGSVEHRHILRINPLLSKDSVDMFDASPAHMEVLLADAARIIDERRAEIDKMAHLLLCTKGR